MLSLEQAEYLLARHPDDSGAISGLAPLNDRDGVGSPAVGNVEASSLRIAESNPVAHGIGSRHIGTGNRQPPAIRDER